MRRETATNSAVQVAPAILQAATETREQIFERLGTTAGGLTQAEAEQRVRTAGLSEVAQEKPQGWPVRLLKIVRNPLVILLVTLSTISFATGDARAGTVMALMVALTVGLRFWQEARADAGRSEVEGHDPRLRHRNAGRKGE